MESEVDDLNNLLLFPIQAATQQEIEDDETWVKVKGPIVNVNYPVCGVDFETYYSKKYSLEKMTTWEYVYHRSFNAYLVAFWCWIPETQSWWRWVGHPSNAPWKDIANMLWCSHNASFDELVFMRLLHEKKIEANRPRRWVCTADLAAYHQTPRNLADAMWMLAGIKVDKSIRDKMRDGTADPEALKNYAATDSKGTAILWCTLGEHWPWVEQVVSEAQRRAGWKGIYLDQPLLNSAIEKMEKVKREVVMKLPWTGREVVASKKGIAIECAKMHIAPPPSLALDDPETEKWQRTYGVNTTWLEDIRRYTKANQLQGASRLSLEHMRSNGTIPFELIYRKAPHTARWQSGKKIRLQNLDRDGFEGFHIRNTYRARPKKKFIISDLSQIEPRVLNWLVGDTEFLKSCASGQSPYEAHARSTMGYTNPDPLKKVDPSQYQLAKARTLALGYQAGPPKFIEMARSMCGITVFLDDTSHTQDGKHYVSGQQLQVARWKGEQIKGKWSSFPSARDAVKDFRSKSKKIVNFWYSMEAEMRRHVGQDWHMPLPNGDVIRYFNLRHEGMHFDTPRVVATVIRGKGGMHTKTDLYGGKLVENMVQRVARDVLADMIARLVHYHSNVLTFLWSVHDEIICEADEERSEEALALLVNVMSTPPTWAADLPVASEGGIFDCYTK